MTVMERRRRRGAFLEARSDVDGINFDSQFGTILSKQALRGVEVEVGSMDGLLVG